MKTWMWLGLAAAALLLVGLVFGFAPVKAGQYDCGSAFRQSNGLEAQQVNDMIEGGDGKTECDSARSSRQPVAWSALGVGVLLAGAAWAVALNEPSRQTQRRESTSQRV